MFGVLRVSWIKKTMEENILGVVYTGARSKVKTVEKTLFKWAIYFKMRRQLPSSYSCFIKVECDRIQRLVHIISPVPVHETLTCVYTNDEHKDNTGIPNV